MTMVSPEIIIFDVGHGNASIIRGQGETAIVDSARGAHVIDFLIKNNITTIDCIVVSHADADHIDGLVPILMNQEISIRHIYVNPNAIKDTEVWHEFRSAASEARHRGAVVHLEINSESPSVLKLNAFVLEVIHPSQDMMMTGPGGKDLDRVKLDANSTSVVIRVCHEDRGRVLLAADIDGHALASIIKSKKDIAADILVFPHHGALPKAADIAAFSDQLLQHCKPTYVIFSNGRGKFDTPNDIIVRRVQHHGCGIACTQLSKKCAESTEDLKFEHLSHYPSAGAKGGYCCAGSIAIPLNIEARSIPHHFASHKKFTGSIVGALCK